jgi:hypothetical protein
MRRTCNGRRRRAWQTPRTAVLSILLITAASAGCEHKGDPEKPGDLSAPASSSSGSSPEALSPSAGEAAHRQPKIRFDQPDYDFGEAEAGDEVEHTFVFENAGDDLLTITKVRTSCGCTAALVSEEKVSPGKTGEIKATLLTKGFQGDVKKSLLVESNDPDNELVRLTIGGKVLPEVTVEPRYLHWEDMKPGEPAEPKKLSIRFVEGRGLRLEKILSESPSVVLTKESEGKNQVAYTVALAESLPEGRLTGRITVRTNSKRMPEVDVPFYAFVQGNVKVVPHLLSLGTIAPGQAATRYLSLTKVGERAFSVPKVKATTDEIKTEIIQKKKGSSYQIKVTYKLGSKVTGRLSERITVFVNDGEQNFIEVPVYGTVEEGAKSAAR